MRLILCCVLLAACSPGERPAASARASAPKPAEPSKAWGERFAVLDLLPAKMGGLEVSRTSLRVARGSGDLLAHYGWMSTGVQVVEAFKWRGNDAELRCGGSDAEAMGCDKTVALGIQKACVTDANKVYGPRIEWRNCDLLFDLKHWKGHKLDEAIRAAEDAEAWMSRFDGSEKPSIDELSANRRALAAVEK